MKLAMIGLGKMGANMARRLIRDGHEVVGYNLETAVTNQLAEEVGLIPAYSLAGVVEKLEPPRVAWVMSVKKARRQEISNVTAQVPICSIALYIWL